MNNANKSLSSEKGKNAEELYEAFEKLTNLEKELFIQKLKEEVKRQEKQRGNYNV